ncbi:hypothetical protein BVI1335_2020005 [Burkholderia vietnamiensis]|nr:hypothetical protein BVI1335_2020005 [Burkholderia vietnamiensis]
MARARAKRVRFRIYHTGRVARLPLWHASEVKEQWS